MKSLSILDLFLCHDTHLWGMNQGQQRPLPLSSLHRPDCISGHDGGSVPVGRPRGPDRTAPVSPHLPLHQQCLLLLLLLRPGLQHLPLLSPTVRCWVSGFKIKPIWWLVTVFVIQCVIKIWICCAQGANEQMSFGSLCLLTVAFSTCWACFHRGMNLFKGCQKMKAKHLSVY